MTENKHPFDLVAQKLKTAWDEPVIEQPASEDWCLLEHTADDTIGVYPQVTIANDDAGDGNQDVPPQSLMHFHLESNANWTDVLSASLRPGNFLLNEKGAALFDAAKLGEYQVSPSIVGSIGREQRKYVLLSLESKLAPETIDFERSEFYFVGQLRMPVGPAEVNSYQEWVEKLDLGFKGELAGFPRFTSLGYKSLYFKEGYTPPFDLFMLGGRLSAEIFITHRFKDALHDSGVTGLTTSPNRRLFASNASF